MSVNKFDGMYAIIQRDAGTAYLVRHGDGITANETMLENLGLTFHQAVEIAIEVNAAEQRGREQGELRMIQRMRAYLNKTEEKYNESRG